LVSGPIGAASYATEQSPRTGTHLRPEQLPFVRDARDWHASERAAHPRDTGWQSAYAPEMDRARNADGLARVLDAAESASPVEAVESVTGALGLALGASSV
jgi:hypothetical protein